MQKQMEKEYEATRKERERDALRYIPHPYVLN